MALLFADGFDMYGTAADTALGRWTSGNTMQAGNSANNILVTGAFGSGQALSWNATSTACSLVAVFLTLANEATVYFSLRVKNITGATSAQSLVLGFQDAGNSQCSIVWRGDNALLVYSGSNGGSVLTTLTSAFSAATWDSYQGKVVIHNTAGSVEIRKNGSASPIINLASVNTRAGSSNNYCNQFTLYSGGSSASFGMDDVILCNGSGAAPNAFLGDLRCVTQMPASVSSAQFTLAPSPISQVVVSAGGTQVTRASGVASYNPMVAAYSGTLANFTVQLITGVTGNLKGALYDASRTTVLATATAVSNPAAGVNTLTFASPPSIVKGTTYYVAWDQDTSITYSITNTASTAYTSSTAYGSFPAASPSLTGPTSGNTNCTLSITPSNNAEYVQEIAEDGDTSYVQSSTANQEDKYAITALSVTPASIVGVVPFALWRRSDAGARTATLSVTANGSADTGEVVGVIPSTGYTYAAKFLPTDPTGATWTTSSINGMLLGVTVAS